MMKNTKINVSLILIAIFALVVVACNPEDGDTGPVGPVGSPGATGPKGDTGPAGQDGQDGQDGNANVQAFVFNIAQGDFSITASPSGNNFRLRHRDTLNVSQINNDVMMNGTVQVFFNSATFSNDPNAWTPMPSSDLGVTFNYHKALGEIRIDINYINTPDPMTGNPRPISIGDYEFKVVVIPPASLIQGMNYEDHEMLEAVYGI